METTDNLHQIKHLQRVLSTLSGFELIICGYNSLKVFREMLEWLRDDCRAKRIVVNEIDISSMENVREFENLLKKKKQTGSSQLFNITGLEIHVKSGQVSSFLNHINLIRDRLARNFPFAFFFWLPENLVQRFALDAPDLWAWRNTVLIFKDEDEEMWRSFETIPERPGEETEFSNFSLEEKQRHIEYLKGVLDDPEKRQATLKSEHKYALINRDLGRLYYLTGEYQEAIIFLKKALTTQEKIGDNKGLSYTINAIGRIYLSLGDYNQAQDYFNKALEINRNLNDRRGEGDSYLNMALFYKRVGDNEKALYYLHQTIEISREIGDIAVEGTTLNNMATIAHAQGDYQAALNYLEQSLKIRRQIADKKGEAATLNNISQIYDAQGNYKTAIHYLEESLRIQQQIGDKEGEGTTLNNIAVITYKQGDYVAALNFLHQSLKIQQQISDNSGTIATLHNMAVIAMAQEDNEKFQQLEMEAYQLALQSGDAKGLYNVGRDLGSFLCQTGHKDQGLPLLQKSLAIGKKARFSQIEKIEELIRKYSEG